MHGYNVVMVRVEHVLDTWKAIRQDTAAAVEDFPAGQMDFRPAPDVMTFGEVARHILEAGEGLTGMLLAGEENFNIPDLRQKVGSRLTTHAGPDAASLAEGLRRSMEQFSARLAAQPPAFFSQVIRRMDGLEVTRLEMLQGLKEHELTHRSHLYLCLRLKGIVPATTRRRMAKQAAK